MILKHLTCDVAGCICYATGYATAGRSTPQDKLVVTTSSNRTSSSLDLVQRYSNYGHDLHTWRTLGSCCENLPGSTKMISGKNLERAKTNRNATLLRISHQLRSWGTICQNQRADFAVHPWLSAENVATRPHPAVHRRSACMMLSAQPHSRANSPLQTVLLEQRKIFSAVVEILVLPSILRREEKFQRRAAHNRSWDAQGCVVRLRLGIYKTKP